MKKIFLGNEILEIIYGYDPTYHKDMFQKVMKEFKQKVIENTRLITYYHKENVLVGKFFGSFSVIQHPRYVWDSASWKKIQSKILFHRFYPDIMYNGIINFKESIETKYEVDISPLDVFLIIVVNNGGILSGFSFSTNNYWL
mgnify:CR=1 FL=1